MVARNDAQKRALNAALNPGDVWAERDAWLPCVQAVQERLMTLGVERPTGLPKVAGELARPVRVLVDAGGLPVPVPEQIWHAMGFC